MPTKAPNDSAQLQRKAAVIDDIKARLHSADAAVLTEYRGLTVTDIANLRAALRPAATDYKIFKNTLARRAAQEVGLTDILGTLEGPIAIAFVRKDGGDPVTAAKALRDFARTNANLIVKGGLLGPRVLTVADVEALADVPPREQLLARIAGGFQAPMVKAAGLFQAFTRNMAYGVKALIDQRIEGGENLPPEESPAPEVATAVSAAGESDQESVEESPAPEAEPEPETTDETPLAEETTAPEAAPAESTESE